MIRNNPTQQVSETPGFQPRSSLKSRSSSNNKAIKLKQQKRLETEEEMKDFDKLKLLAVERINHVTGLKISKFMSRVMFMLVGKKETEAKKRYGFAMIDYLVRQKERRSKVVAIQVMKEAVRERERVKKYCGRLARLEGKLQIRRLKIGYEMLGRVLKGKEEGSSPVMSKSVGKKPSIPIKNMKEQLLVQPINNDNNNKMALSSQIRDVLTSLQRYDRVMYLSDVEKSLKSSSQHQIRRLEKIKNSNKQTQNIFYDNQLTLIVISHLLKSINELLRESRAVAQANEEKKLLEKKIIEINQQKNQEMKELRESYRSRESEEAVRVKQLDGELKQFNKFIETIGGLYGEGYQSNYDRIQKSLEIQSKKLNSEIKETTIGKKQITSILLGLTEKCRQHSVSLSGVQFEIKEINNELKSIISIDPTSNNANLSNTQIDKTLKHLEKQKRLFETKSTQSKLQLKQYYETIILLISQSYSLHYELYLRSAQISQLNSKLQSNNNFVNNTNQRSHLTINQLKEDLEEERSKSKEVEGRLRQTHRSESFRESKKNPLQQYVREWADIVENMIESIKTGDKTWSNDINKKKKWINSHKNNEELIKLVNNDVILMNIIAGKERDDVSYKSSPEKDKGGIKRRDSANSEEETKTAQLQRENGVLVEEVKKLKQKLYIIESHPSSNQTQILDLENIVSNINKSLLSDEEKFHQEQWFGFRSTLRSYLASHPQTKLVNIVHGYNHLIEFLESQLDSHEQLNQELKEMADEITTFKASTKSFSLLINKDLVCEESVDKMKRNAQAIIRRIEESEKLHGELSPSTVLYLEDTQSKLKLLEIIDSQMRGMKELREENLEYLLKLKDVEGNRELNQKLNMPSIEPMIGMQESGRRLQQLMKIQSSIDDIVEERPDSSGHNFSKNKLRDLESETISLQEQLEKYKEIFERYSSQQKQILQRIQEYEETILREKQRTKDLQYKIYDLENKNRELSYKYNLISHEKAMIENIVEKESTEKDQVVEQLEMKEQVIKELSRDITVLESKVQRLQENNQRLDKDKKELNAKMIDIDAVNIDLLEKNNEYEQLREEMTKAIRQSTMKSLRDEEANVNELRLASEIEQYRIMIDQLSKKLEKTEGEKIELEEKRRFQEERNKKLKVDLEKMMEEREIAFKEYEDIVEVSVKQKEEYQFRILQKDKQMKISSEEVGRNLKALEEYEGKVKEDQLKLSKDIERIVGERLASQQLYYNNLLEVGKTSYEGMIKNQKNEIERLIRQVEGNTKSIGIIQELESETSRLRLEVITANQYKQQINKKYQEQLQTNELLKKQEYGYLEEIQILKGRFVENIDYESQLKVELTQQENYFNEIINSNADCYVNNEKNFLMEIERYKSGVIELESLLGERELAITNQSRQLENKHKEIEKLKIQLETQRMDEELIYQEISKLREEVKSKHLGDMEDSSSKTKLLYLEQNESYLRDQIDRLVQENKILSKERDRILSENENNSMALGMKAELKQLEEMFNKLRDEKEIALYNMRMENESLAQRLKQREIQLIEQQRLNASLAHRFEDRERQLIDKINATDSVNRELSDHVETVRQQYHNLKTLINQNQKLEREQSPGRSNEFLGGSSNELSLADKLRLLSLSDNNDRNGNSPNKNGRKETRNEGFSLNPMEQPPFNLADSNNVVFEGGRVEPISVISEQRYLLLSQEKDSLKNKLQNIQMRMRDKEIQIMKLSKNYITSQHQNKRLRAEIRTANDKEREKFEKESYEVSNESEYLQLQSELSKVKSENAFFKYKNSNLENQIKAEKGQEKTNKAANKEGAPIKRIWGGKDRLNADGYNSRQDGLANRLHSMIINTQTSEEDLLEISILKKISQEVGDLVESNNSLNRRIEQLQKQNQVLYNTINKIADGEENRRQGGGAVAIKYILKLHKMIARILEWVDNEDILSDQDTSFTELEDKLHHYLKKSDSNKYIEVSQQLLKSLIARIINSRQELLSQQAEQVIGLKQKLAEIVSEQIEQISESQDGRSSVVIDSHHKLDQVGVLLKAYSKTKNPKIMAEVEKLLMKKEKRYR